MFKLVSVAAVLAPPLTALGGKKNGAVSPIGFGLQLIGSNHQLVPASPSQLMAAKADDVEIAAAKVQVGRSARFGGETAIQLHGGIGMTMEYKAGHYFKRLTMIDMAFGDADHHLRALAQAGGLN